MKGARNAQSPNCYPRRLLRGEAHLLVHLSPPMLVTLTARTRRAMPGLPRSVRIGAGMRLASRSTAARGSVICLSLSVGGDLIRFVDKRLFARGDLRFLCR